MTPEPQNAIWRAESPLEFFDKASSLEIVLYVPPGTYERDLSPGTWMAYVENHHGWHIEVYQGMRKVLLDEWPKRCWWTLPPKVISAAFIDKGPPGVCEHGNPGGCEISCRGCGHTCRRHQSGMCNHQGDIPGFCGCDQFDGTEG